MNQTNNSKQKTHNDQYQTLLDHQQDMLTLFSGDQRLTYKLETNGEHFVLQPQKLMVQVPMLFFKSQPYSQNRFLFHLYETLALYPDYQRSPGLYLNRMSAFRADAEEMTDYFLVKVRAAGLQEDAAYAPTSVYDHMENEIEDFLDGWDTWVSVLTVMEEAPVYQNSAVKKDIGQMLLWEDVFPHEDNPLGIHRDLAGSLMTAEFFGMEEIGWKEIQKELKAPVFDTERYAFLRKETLKEISLRQGIGKTDPLLHTILFPSLLKLWKQDIDRMELSPTIKDEQQADTSKNANRRRTPSMTRDDRRNMLKELNDQKKAQAKSAERLLNGETDLSAFGVTASDQALFAHYQAAVRSTREEMKRYWQKLIGDASREINVRLRDMPKGKLDVDTLIRSWPSFTEAERRQNYKELTVFDSYELQKVTKELPRYLDISFVIDNSGSMKSGKLEPAREALAAVLLSLQDFEHYLHINAEQTHQRTEVRIETWLFGTACRKVLSFDDRLRGKQAGTILSIARLNGTGGVTDDGACLQEILKEMTPQMIREQLSGKRIRMIFEVTDGASSFPGAAKKAVEELCKDHVRIQAIEIGSAGDAAARKAFGYIFGPHGLFLGDRIRELPSALTRAVQSEMTDIFRK